MGMLLRSLVLSRMFDFAIAAPVVFADDLQAPSTATSQTMTAIDYRGYRIEVSPIGKGWRASIYSPGSARALADSPSNLEKSPTEEIVVKAKRIIDARLGPRLGTEE
jgi:hypothetical protein